MMAILYTIGLDGTQTTVEIHHDWFVWNWSDCSYVDGKVDWFISWIQNYGVIYGLKNLLSNLAMGCVLPIATV